MFVRKHATSSSEIRAQYDQLSAHHWLPPHSSLLAWLVRLLAARPGQTLLDVACGDGQLRSVAQQAGLIYFGLDISSVAVQAAGGDNFLVGDGAFLPFGDNSFDRVASIGSLEHYLDMAQGIREMRRVLKRDGLACIVVPNAFGLTWNVLRVWRTGDLFDDDGQPIQRFGTRGAWTRLLVQHGFTVHRILGHERSWPRTMGEWKWYLRLPGEAVLALLAPFLPLDMRRHFAFLCTKAELPDRGDGR